MKHPKPLALLVVASMVSAVVHADPMLERQAQLEKERSDLLHQLDQQNQAATGGWHWYKDPEPEPEPEPESDTPALPTPETSTSKNDEEKVKIDVKWLREQLPVMLDDAMNHPGDMKRVKLYWLAQKMAVDMATKFQDSTRRMYVTNPQMNEDVRRPESEFALANHNEQVKEGRKQAVQKVFDRAGLWFFYSSTCPYCQKEGPVLKYLERFFDVNILAVSMDGQPLPGTDFKDVVVDEGGVMAAKLSVDKTPSMFLVTKDGSTIHKVSEGLLTMDELLETILYVAQGAGVISERELQESRDVRQYLMTDPVNPVTKEIQSNQASLIELSKSDLAKGPDALINELESRLNFPSYDTVPVGAAGGNQ